MKLYALAILPLLAIAQNPSPVGPPTAAGTAPPPGAPLGGSPAQVAESISQVARNIPPCVLECIDPSLGAADPPTAQRGYPLGALCADTDFINALQGCLNKSSTSTCNSQTSAGDLLCDGAFILMPVPTVSVADYQSSGSSAWHAAATSAAAAGGSDANGSTAGGNAKPTASGASPAAGSASAGASAPAAGKGSATSLGVPVLMAIGAVLGVVLV